ATLPPGGTTGDLQTVSLQGEYATYPNQPLLIMDGFEIGVQTMMDLDPDRVESITLLKDASATAIYGAKAANGVIVIETKVPEVGRLRVSYGGNVRVETPDLSDYNLMNASEKLTVEKMAGFYPEDRELSYLQEYQGYLREVKRGVNTYWLSQPLRTAVQHRHALTFEGGDRALRYKLYVGINNSAGVMKGSKRNTQTGTLDLSYRFDKFLLKNSVTMDNAVGDNSPYGSFREYTLLNPYLRPFDENGNIQKIMQVRDIPNQKTELISNPMYNTTFNSKNRNTNFSIRNLFKLEYNPLETIKLQADISLSKGVGKVETFRPAQHTFFDKMTDPTLKGDFRRVQSENFTYSIDLTGGYNNVFSSVHYLTLNARMTLQERNDSQ
ncbi:MAG: TonB-dependent receptor plug domain-containing protein, partial [Odoribacter sp.]